jgi:hypothetical protein
MKAATPRAVPRAGPKTLTGSADAKRTAAGILEVLSGLRSAGEGAQALGISLMRYYVLETRALQGLIGALEPRPRGRRQSAEDRLGALGRENRRLAHELGRMQGLVRAAQRSVGLAPVGRKIGAKDPKTGRRRRRPHVRAQGVVAALRAPGGSDAPKSAAKPEGIRPSASPGTASAHEVRS